MKKIYITVLILFLSGITNAQNISVINRSKLFNIKEIYIGKDHKIGNTIIKRWTSNLLIHEVKPSCIVILKNKEHGDFTLKVIWKIEYGNIKGDMEKLYSLYNITEDISYEIKFEK